MLRIHKMMYMTARALIFDVSRYSQFHYSAYSKCIQWHNHMLYEHIVDGTDVWYTQHVNVVPTTHCIMSTWLVKCWCVFVLDDGVCKWYIIHAYCYCYVYFNINRVIFWGTKSVCMDVVIKHQVVENNFISICRAFDKERQHLSKTREHRFYICTNCTNAFARFVYC